MADGDPVPVFGPNRRGLCLYYEIEVVFPNKNSNNLVPAGLGAEILGAFLLGSRARPRQEWYGFHGTK